MKKPIVVAHRGGYEGPYKENTLENFLDAIKNGADAIEIDLRFDHLKNRFYLEHDFIHAPYGEHKVLQNVITKIPKGTIIFVELKTVAWITKDFARKFLKAYEQYFDPEHTVVISLNQFVLAHVRKLNPKIRIGYLCGNPMWNFLFQNWFVNKIKAEFYMLHKRIFHDRNIAFGRKHGMKIVPYTLNSDKRFKMAMSKGSDAIVTDYPSKLIKFLKNGSSQ